jgi:carbon monoxide dehydrogenase subunit G
MALRIEKSFTVDAPRAAVWAFLVDPHRVAACLPGAAITDQLDGSTYAGTMTVKVGPVTASYKGKLKFERLDEAAGEAELSGSGQETKGKGGADMKMASRVVALAPDRTEVTVVSEVNVFGLLAQMGRGMIEDVADQMFARFSRAMAAALATTPAGAAEAPSSESSIAPTMPASPAATATAPVASTTAPHAVPVREEVLDVGALGAAAAKRAAGRLVRNPALWATIAAIEAILLLVCWLD